MEFDARAGVVQQQREGAAMRAAVVYESMYGNTRAIAEAIGTGLRPTYDVSVIRVGQARPAILEEVELLIVGGPTHAWSMSRARTRQSAAASAEKPGSRLALEPDAIDVGLREWFESLGRRSGRAAAFDTRIDAPPMLTGRASKAIARRLQRLGYELAARPESFLVTKRNTLVAGEVERAQAWGARLASTLRTV
jgi:hypothetical protein